MPEVIEKRTRTGKVYDLGIKDGRHFFSPVISRGAKHYKDDYQDRGEQWKDIDLHWDGRHLTAAPYELTVEGQKITFRDKESGEVSTIERLTPDIPFEIIPSNERVSFRHSVSQLPFEATFRVTGRLPIRTRAFDDDGELEVEATVKDGVLTERITAVRNVLTKEVRPVKGLIRIDPTVIVSVAASTDDCIVYDNGSAWTILLTNAQQSAGYFSATFRYLGGGMKFLNINVPAGATFENGCKIALVARNTRSANTVNSVLIGELTNSPATFGTLANYQGRRGTDVGGANNNNRTIASVNYNAIATHTSGVSYDTPEIKTLAQEIYDNGWTGDATDDMVYFWDDHANNSTNAGSVFREESSWDHASFAPPELTLVYSAGTAHAKALADTLALADAILKDAGLYKAEAAFSLADSIIKGPVIIQAEASFALADSVVKAPALNKAESFSLADTFARAVTFVRALADTQTIADAISKAVGKPIAEAAMSITDVFVKTIGAIHLKVFSETMVITDSFVAQYCQWTNLKIKIGRIAISRLQSSRLPLARFICRRFTE